MPSVIRSAGRLAGAIFFILQLSACSYTQQSARLEQAPPPSLSSSEELKQTPFFAQQRYQCGPAALAMVLVDRGVEVNPDELVDKVYLPKRQGSVPVEMEAAARGYGMLVYPLSKDLEALLLEVASGNPVLVLQNLAFGWWPRWHYAVVVGYDLNEGTITLRSGVTRRYVASLGLFETTWRRADYWARVVLPPDTIPASATALRYIEAAVALEQSKQDAAARAAYRSATERWPDSALAWLAQGNLAYRLGKGEEAEEAFRHGLEAEPSNAALWNNLAYALVLRQCGSQALAAVRCAIALSPDVAEYHDSLRELATVSQETEGCAPVICPANGASQGNSE